MQRLYRRMVSTLLILSVLIAQLFWATPRAMASAGLYYGPIVIGNLEISITNTHEGAVGDFGWVRHYNVQVLRINGPGRIRKTLVANYHVMIENRAGKWCMTVWESKKEITLFQGCSDDYMEVGRQGVKAIGSAIWDMLTHGNWVAKAVIIGFLAAFFLDLIVPADPVPIFPLGMRDPTGAETEAVRISTAANTGG